MTEFSGRRLERLLNLGYREFLKEVRLEDLSLTDQNGWAEVCERIIQLMPTYARPRITRETMYNLIKSSLCIEDPSFTLEMFKKHYKNGEWLGPIRLQRLAQHFIEDGHVARIVERFGTAAEPKREDKQLPLYDILLRLARVDDRFVREFGFAAKGHYQLWRHSTSVPKHYVKGIMTIETDRPNVIYVTTRQRYRDQGKTSRRVQPLRSRDERFLGYLIPLSRECCMLVGRGVEIVGFRVIIFTSIAPIPRSELSSPWALPQIFSMAGYTMGTADSRGFISPVYIERIEDKDIKQHRSEMDMYKIDEIPEKIAEILISQLIQF